MPSLKFRLHGIALIHAAAVEARVRIAGQPDGPLAVLRQLPDLPLPLVLRAHREHDQVAVLRASAHGQAPVRELSEADGPLAALGQQKSLAHGALLAGPQPHVQAAPRLRAAVDAALAAVAAVAAGRSEVEVADLAAEAVFAEVEDVALCAAPSVALALLVVVADPAVGQAVGGLHADAAVVGQVDVSLHEASGVDVLREVPPHGQSDAADVLHQLPAGHRHGRRGCRRDTCPLRDHLMSRRSRPSSQAQDHHHCRVPMCNVLPTRQPAFGDAITINAEVCRLPFLLLRLRRFHQEPALVLDRHGCLVVCRPGAGDCPGHTVSVIAQFVALSA
mmetsp:Transcript_92105/g.240331  ORF Transcript_92105/g.240331 Transcript_92105/m.240331 type:complete len:333 (+) Transcript_92105:1710-2708(+)